MRYAPCVKASWIILPRRKCNWQTPTAWQNSGYSLLRTNRLSREEREPSDNPCLIGIHTFHDTESRTTVIYDWRAPISSMFYDHELGEASYQSPSGEINGEISLKRQYRIRAGKMEFMIESALTVHDDILQKELSFNADDKMKNIVATIQREQNRIIRNEEARTLIIQGVAVRAKLLLPYTASPTCYMLFRAVSLQKTYWLFLRIRCLPIISLTSCPNWAKKPYPNPAWSKYFPKYWITNTNTLVFSTSEWIADKTNTGLYRANWI